MEDHSDDENSHVEEISMGQLWDEWDTGETDAEEEEEEGQVTAELENVPPPVAGAGAPNSPSDDDPILSSSRYVLGYNRTGFFSNLVVRCAEDPSMARMFKIGKAGKNSSKTFYCSCQKVLSMFIEDGERVLRGNVEQHDDRCRGSSFKELFFELKRYALVFGTSEEIDFFEQASHSICEEPGYSLVDQRNWLFFESKVEIHADKKAVILVREPDARTLCHRYEIQPATASDNQVRYACTTCADKQTAASLIVHNLSSGLHNVFQPPTTQHSVLCYSTNVETLAAEHGVRIKDDVGLDILAVIPKEYVTLAPSPLGEPNGRLIIKDATDPSLCQLFSRSGAVTGMEKRRFVCSKCNVPFCAFYLGAEGTRIIAPKVNHCQLRSFTDVMEQCLAAKPVDSLRGAKAVHSAQTNTPRVRDLAGWPVISSDRIKMGRTKAALVVVNIYNQRFGYKFVGNKKRMVGTKNKRVFKCLNCPAIVVVEQGRFNSVVREGAKHENACLPIPNDQWLLDEKPERLDESGISINSSGFEASREFSVDQTSNERQLIENDASVVQLDDNEHSDDSADQAVVIARNRWIWGFSLHGNKNSLLVRSTDDNKLGRMYTQSVVHPNTFHCPCRQRVVHNIVDGEENLTGIEAEHGDTCREVPFWEMFFQLEKRHFLFGSHEEIDDFKRNCDLFFKDKNAEENNGIQKYAIVPAENWKVGYSSAVRSNGKLIVKMANDSSYCYQYTRTKDTKKSKEKAVFLCSHCKKVNAFQIFSDPQRVVSLTGLHGNGCMPQSYDVVSANQEQLEANARLDNGLDDSLVDDSVSSDASFDGGNRSSSIQRKAQPRRLARERSRSFFHNEFLANPPDADSTVQGEETVLDQSRWILGRGNHSELTKLLVKSDGNSSFGRVYTPKACLPNLFYCQCKQVLTVARVDGSAQVSGNEGEHDPECLEEWIWNVLVEIQKSTLVKANDVEIDEFQRMLKHFDKANKHKGYRNFCVVDKSNWRLGLSPTGIQDYRLIVRFGRDRYYEYEQTKAFYGARIKRAFLCCQCRFSCGAALMTVDEPPRVVAPGFVHSQDCLPLSFEDVCQKQVNFKNNPKKHHKVRQVCPADESRIESFLEWENDVANDSNLNNVEPPVAVEKRRWIMGYGMAGMFDKLLVRDLNNASYSRMYTLKKREPNVFYCDCNLAMNVSVDNGETTVTESQGLHEFCCKTRPFWMEFCQLQKLTFMNGTGAEIDSFNEDFQAHFYEESKTKFSSRFYQVVDKSKWEQVNHPGKSPMLVVREASNNDLCYVYLLSSTGTRKADKCSTYLCRSCRNQAAYQIVDGSTRVVAPNFIHDSECKPVRYTKHVSGPTAGNKVMRMLEEAAIEENDGEIASKRRRVQEPSEHSSSSVSTQSDTIQEADVECSVDLNAAESNTGQLRNAMFIRPSNVWLSRCAAILEVQPSKSAYRVWASLDDVDLSSADFPATEHVKRFPNGFHLFSYLCTGSEEHASTVKDKIGMYIFDEYKTFGIVDNVDCSRLTPSDIRDLIFSADMNPLHLAAVSRLLKSTVVVYNYNSQARFCFEVDDEFAPTVVACVDKGGFFVITDQ